MAVLMVAMKAAIKAAMMVVTKDGKKAASMADQLDLLVALRVASKAGK